MNVTQHMFKEDWRKRK